MGFSFVTGLESIMHVDNASFDGTHRDGALNADGQLWIGSTASRHVRRGTLTAGTGISITNGAGSITISNSGATTDLHTAKFIVGDIANGANYSTIAAALLAAAPGDTIFLQTGTYTENLTLRAGINLCAFTGDGTLYKIATQFNVKIIGKLTATFTGSCNISNICLQTNSDFLLAVTGTNATTVVLTNCFLNVANNTAISLTSNGGSIIQFVNCFGSLNTTGVAYFVATSGAIAIFGGQFANQGISTTPSTFSNAVIEMTDTTFISIITTTNASGVNIGKSYIGIADSVAIALTGTSTLGMGLSFVTSGTATAITIGAGCIGNIFTTGISTSNANSLSGAGSILSSGLTYVNGASGTSKNAITTQTPFVSSNDAVTVVSPGGYPYTTIPQDAVILVDTSSARTIVPYASPATGQKHIIKDSVGSAASNNITITPSGKNIDGAASSTINIAYGSVTIVYNGTEWSII